MVAAVDPTYPLYPIACILSAAMLLLVCLTSLIRQNRNLGVALLYFWLFFENLTAGINAIIWAGNADVKLHIYCDISTHLQKITTIVKPMATLIITRRLYLITGQRSAEIFDGKMRRRNTVIEWTLGVMIPLILAGPVYYIVQVLRFSVLEGFGCVDAEDGSILDMLLLWMWTVIPPLISITVYYPRVVRLLYRDSRSINRFLNSNNSLSRTNYFRILAFVSLDIFLTLPLGITNLVLLLAAASSKDYLVLYPGWTYNHTDWEPQSVSYADIVARGPLYVAQQYFTQWSSLITAFALFGLFKTTSEACTAYWHAISTAALRFGWKLPSRAHEARSTLVDGESRVPPLDTLADSELRSRPFGISIGAGDQETTSGKDGPTSRMGVDPGKQDTELAKPIVAYRITHRIL